jgi:uncharacterized protein (DUF111 family)
MVETSYGPISVKIGEWHGQIVQISPEYESCRQAAQRSGAPLKEIYRAAEVKAHSMLAQHGRVPSI